MGGYRIVAGLILVVAAAATGPAAADTITYTNARFGTSVTFPAELFDATLPPPQNGDGRTFLSEDGASLAVFGQNNALMVTPETLADEASQPHGRAGFEVTYRRTGRDWVVLSGFEAGDVFYQRWEFGADDVIHSFLLKYPAELKPVYDRFVGPIANSLQGP